jgi:hypothetical protein
MMEETRVERAGGNAAQGPRDELLLEWRAARRRRQESEPGGEAYREACEDLARIEIEIARVERAMDPPRV